MKKRLLPLIVLAAAGILFSQVEQHEVTVVTIEVPVRVTDGGRFVDNLTLEDFDLYENGLRQEINSLYLVRKTDIARQEREGDVPPQLNRQFYFLFQLTDFNPRISDAVEYFFERVFQAGDSLTIMTLQERYSLSPAALQTKSPRDLAGELQGLIRRDTMLGTSVYNSLLRELKRLTAQIGGGTTTVSTDSEGGDADSTLTLELLFPRYKDNLEKMEQMRVVNEQSFLQFAQVLRRQPGQKHVFFFYEREFRPEIQQSDLNRMLSIYQDRPNILAELQDLFQMYARYPVFNPERITRAFGDSGITLHFLFINKEPELEPGIYMREQSEDVYSSVSSVANITGGIVDSSLNPGASFQKAAELVESYYILYYTPQAYTEDGQYREIKVFVKDRNYKIGFRPGYYARR